MKDIALITLHGMGSQEEDYHEDLVDGLKKRLDETWNRIAFQSVYYAEILQVPQRKLWKKIKEEPDNDIDASKLRKFLLYGIGDAGSLEHSAHGDKKTYKAVRKTISTALDKAFADLGNSLKPVVIVAHSLGGQVISDYLWDLNPPSGSGGTEIPPEDPSSDADKFRRLESLTNLITTGCNIPLFVGGFGNIECFEHPNEDFHWDNYYDPDDILGWPLSQLGPKFKFIEDHHINAGGLFTSWNPLSHTQYWDDKSFIKPLAKMLEKLLPS